MRDHISPNEAGNIIIPSFVKSLFLTAVVAACATIFWILTDVLKVDFLHFNPHRSQGNAMQMMVIFPPVFAVLACVAVALIFGPAHAIQILLASPLLRRYGKRGLFGLVLCVPLLSILSWYCFDYIMPLDDATIAGDPDAVPLAHGLTAPRYLKMLLAQSTVTLFTVLRLFLEMQGRGKWKIYLLTAALLAGACYGSVSAYTR